MRIRPSQMKVLQVIPTLAAGGAEGFITNLAVSLADLGVEVRFFLLAGVWGERGRVLQERLRLAGVEVVGAEQRKSRSAANLLHLVRLIRSWKPDIVQANLSGAEVASVAARVLSMGAGSCYVRRLANTGQCVFLPGCKGRLIDRSFTLTIANSPAVADAYCRFLGKPRNGKLVTIANGARLLDVIPSEEERIRSRCALGISRKAFVVAHIGSMGRGGTMCLEKEQKAHHVLLSSFAEAFAKDSECVLLCVGDGSLRPEIERLARKLGLGNRALFLGEIPEPWIALGATDVFFFPSRYEGLPNALVEAASCGLPVVGSDIPEIRYLSPGTAWLLVPVDDVPAFANALRTVRADLSGFRSRAIEGVPHFRERFSMEACARKYLDAYTQALPKMRRNG
jgi:glycosyltransferase involved in cell wall biosynthesis